MDIAKLKNQQIPKGPGSYQFYEKGGKVLYVGKASDLRSRVFSYWRESANHTPAKAAMMKEVARVDWIETETEIEALLLEANLIKKLQPPFNVDLRDDKRFLYIKVSTADEIPGVFATRKIDRSGRYFGPFTNALSVRETIRALRKIWPYCTERRRLGKPCFYYQIGRCLGPCGGAVGIAEYQERVIKPIIMFLEGKKKTIIRNLEKRSRELEKKLGGKAGKGLSGPAREEAERELAGVNYELLNMHRVLDHANIIKVGEKYAADVVELAKVLRLARPPRRIEGYDIADIFGREAVGAMVVFTDGEPDKSHYRKFRIRIGQGEANDVRMFKEILERRFKHEVASGTLRSVPDATTWPAPDLVIVDGGKAQLNAALSVLAKAGREIPVLAVSKGAGLRSAAARDKIFFPGELKPLELPLASPALHIIKRVRDEAHRFAVGYHKLLRNKKMFGAKE